MPTLNVNKTYDTGVVLTEQQLDDAFDSIETFLNVTGIGADNIQDNSITAAELQTSSVTESKLATDAISTTKIQDGAVTLAKLAAALQGYLAPRGSILAYSGATDPSGYLICDGRAISRSTYPDLFSLVSVSFGQGDGTTTFNIPDLRGRFLRGVDGSAGRDPDSGARTAMATGGATGNNLGSVQQDQLGSHNHGIYTDGGPNIGVQSVFVTAPQSNLLNNAITFVGGAETRPRNAYVNYIIKV